MHGSTTPRTTVTEKDNVQNGVQALLDDMVEDAYQEKKKGSMLIFDFDQAITNKPMHSFFVPKGYSDYNSGEENAVTEEKIKEFLQNKDSGIKNEGRLKHILQSALSSGVEVAIVSLAYPKSVEYIVKNHLDLTEEQAQSIKVFEGATKRQTLQIEDPAKIAKKITNPQDPQIGKHLCVLYLLKAHKNKGMFPQKVMLVDGNMRNTNPVDDFHRNIKELLEKDMKSFLENIDQEIAEVDISEEELKNITFKGINVSDELTTGKVEGSCYLDKVEKWIKGSIQNLQDSKNESGLDTPLTPPPSYVSADGSEKSLLSDGKKTNRFLQKVKYVMQKKKVIVPFVGLATMCCTMAIALSVQQRGFIEFVSSVNPVTIFGGVLASCLVLGIMWQLMQAVRTKEHKIKERDTQKVLDEILDTLPKDKCIKSLILKYSNGNRIYFTFHSLQGKEINNANIVELIGQPIYYKSKVNSLVNDRLWLPILSTVLITGSITFPLTLYSTGGLSNIVNLYTNPTIYWPVTAISCILLLFTVVCALHHWNKTDFKDYLLLHKQDASSEKLNETFIEVVKESQEKISSKLLQVVAEPCGHPDIIYIVN